MKLSVYRVEVDSLIDSGSILPLSMRLSTSTPFMTTFVVAFANAAGIEADITEARVGRYTEAEVALLDTDDDRQTLA